MQKLLNIKEFADMMGISIQTTRIWIRQGKIGYHKLGNRIRFSEQDIDEFLNDTKIIRKL
jgi:excisionase family DNA binding protein